MMRNRKLLNKITIVVAVIMIAAMVVFTLIPLLSGLRL